MAHKIQLDYVDAKAHLYGCIEQKMEAMQPYRHLRDTDYEQYAEMMEHFELQYGVCEARQRLREAEDALIDWAVERVRCSKHYSAARHAKLFDEALSGRNLGSIRKKLVDLSVRLLF